MTAPNPQPGQQALQPGQIAVDANDVITALRAQISQMSLDLAVAHVRAEQAEATAAHLGARVRELEADGTTEPS